MSDVMNLDDMLEAGDNNRVDNLEGVHGLIAFLLNNTNELDIEAEIFEIIKNRWDDFSDTWKRDFYEFLDTDDYIECAECEKFFRKEDTILCECDERVCEDCCGNRDFCENCWKQKARAEADWVDAEIDRRKEEELF